MVIPTALSSTSLFPHHPIHLVQPPLRLSNQLLPRRPKPLIPLRLHPVQFHQYLSQYRLAELLVLELSSLLIPRRALHEATDLR